MDVMEGHPAALFYWFFETDQGSLGNLANILMTLHGTDTAMTHLVDSIVQRQSQFDDGLGPEILLALLNPSVSFKTMVDDASFLKRNLREDGPARYLYGGGQAYPIPDNLTMVGNGAFRSERLGGSRFEPLSNEISHANGRAAPFFQQAFDLRPLQNYLIIAHRIENSVLTFDLGERLTVSADDLLRLIEPLRSIARKPLGAADLGAIRTVTEAVVTRSAIRSVARVLWQTIRPTIHPLNLANPKSWSEF